MRMKPLVVGDLVAKIPIIQGGMGVGVSRYRLASSVAKEGGIGVISTAQIGYDEPGYSKNQIETNLKAIKKHIDKAREISPAGIIGVNIMVATKQFERYVKAACEAGADIIISGAGLPINLPKLVKGYMTKIAPIVSSLKGAQVILKLWDRKCQATADLIVVEGPRAGGHLGFTREQLDNIDDINMDLELKNIIEYKKQYEEKYQKKIPVVFAGGIFSQDDIRHVLDLGCDGVQIASRFVVTEECDASQEFKDAYLNAKKEDIEIVNSPVGMPGRAIRTTFMEDVSRAKIPVKSCFKCLENCNPATIPYCITKALVSSVEGDTEGGLVFCSDNVHRLDKMTSVKEIFKELVF